jgi:uncharacterized protein (DUF2141 family)
MITRFFLLLTLAIAFSSSAFADSHGFTVSGEVSFTEKGVILLQLLNATQYSEGQSSELGTAVKVGDAEMAAGKAAFAFEGVPAGEYLLQGFQDVNGNGEMDSGFAGPTEPWVIYKYTPSAFSEPEFDELKVAVAENVSGLSFEVKK